MRKGTGSLTYGQLRNLYICQRNEAARLRKELTDAKSEANTYKAELNKLRRKGAAHE